MGCRLATPVAVRPTAPPLNDKGPSSATGTDSTSVASAGGGIHRPAGDEAEDSQREETLSGAHAVALLASGGGLSEVLSQTSTLNWGHLSVSGQSCALMLMLRPLEARFLASPIQGTIALPAASANRTGLRLLDAAARQGPLTLPWFVKCFHPRAAARVPLLPLSAAILAGNADLVAAIAAMVPLCPQLAPAGGAGAPASKLPPSGSLSPSSLPSLPSPESMARLFVNAYVAGGVGDSSALPSNADASIVRVLKSTASGFLSKSTSEDDVLLDPAARVSLMRGALGRHRVHVYGGEHAVHALPPLLLAAVCGDTDVVVQLVHSGARVDIAVAYPLTVRRWGEALVALHTPGMRSANAARGAVGSGLRVSTMSSGLTRYSATMSPSNFGGASPVAGTDSPTADSSGQDSALRSSTGYSLDPFSAEAKGGTGPGRDDPAFALMAAADAAAEQGWRVLSPGLPDLSSARSAASLAPGWVLPRGNGSLVPAGSTLMHVAARSGSVLSMCTALGDTIIRLAAESIAGGAAVVPGGSPTSTTDAVLASVFEPRCATGSRRPSAALKSTLPSSIFARAGDLGTSLPPLASAEPGAAGRFAWSTPALRELQRVVTVVLDILAVRMLLQAAGAFHHWRPAAGVCLRDSPFPTAHILTPSAGVSDPRVQHVLTGLAASTERRTITQHAPIHTLTRCVTPHPAQAVLDAFTQEGEEEGEDEELKGIAVPEARGLGQLLGSHQPSSVSEVAAPSKAGAARTQAEYWRDADAYASQISTQASVHIGHIADKWRHHRTAGEDKHGLGHLAGLERDAAAAAPWTSAVTVAPTVRLSGSSRSGRTGRTPRNPPEVPPFETFSAPLPGLLLSSLAQASLALTTFAVGASEAAGGVAPARCLLAPAMAMTPTGPALGPAGVTMGNSVTGALRDNFFAAAEGEYGLEKGGLTTPPPPPSKGKGLAGDSKGYMVDYLSVLLRSVTALHMRNLVKGATGTDLPLTCAGGVAAATLGVARPQAPPAEGGVPPRVTLAVGQAAYDRGGLPLYAECGSLARVQFTSEGHARPGQGLVPPGTHPATALQSMFGTAALLAACCGSIPPEAVASAGMTEATAMNKLLVSASGMQAAVPQAAAEPRPTSMRSGTVLSGTGTDAAGEGGRTGPSHPSTGLDAQRVSQAGGLTTLSEDWRSAGGAPSPPAGTVPAAEGQPSTIPAAPLSPATSELGGEGGRRRRKKPSLRLPSAVPLGGGGGAPSPKSPAAAAAVPLATLKGRTLGGYAVGNGPGGAMLLTPSKLRRLADDQRSTASWDLSSQGSAGRGGSGGLPRQGSLSSMRSGGGPNSPGGTGGVAMGGAASFRRNASSGSASHRAGSFTLPKHSTSTGGTPVGARSGGMARGFSGPASPHQDVSDVLTAVSSD